ncbi:hypothetical protein DFH09DRAFT_1079012 [Mycena vulgaris]|nr:hypothetical protein DFH09DRAFT_1079012 [Mycena vulgaris]
MAPVVYWITDSFSIYVADTLPVGHRIQQALAVSGFSLSLSGGPARMGSSGRTGSQGAAQPRLLMPFAILNPDASQIEHDVGISALELFFPQRCYYIQKHTGIAGSTLGVGGYEYLDEPKGKDVSIWDLRSQNPVGKGHSARTEYRRREYHSFFSTARAAIGGLKLAGFRSRRITNCPQDEEIAEIQSLLVEPTVRLKRLDDEINELQKALENLTDERDRLTCIPTHRNCVMSASEAPVLLGRICSLWRSIFISTPRLWSRLHTVEPTSLYTSNQSDLAIFQQKLTQRDETTEMWPGQCPLSISLEATPASQGHLLQVLLPFALRWEHVSFAAVPSVLLAALHLNEADVPMLKSISISEIHGTAADLIRSDSLGLLRAPNFIPFPLRQETCPSFQAGAVKSSGSFSPSVLSCGLVDCSFVTSTLRAKLESPVSSSHFLHTLDLECVGYLSTTIRQLFTRLFLPQLRHLKLRRDSNGDETVVSYSPLLAAALRIDGLDLSAELFSTSSLGDFLRALPPSVREVKIGMLDEFAWYSLREDYSIFDDNILEFLIPSPEFPILVCPGLQILEMNHGFSCSEEALLRFIKSRSLKRVVVRFSRDMERDIRPDLQTFVQNGLHFELTYPPPRVFHFSPWQGLEDTPNFF